MLEVHKTRQHALIFPLA